jgi:hypothetical protein
LALDTIKARLFSSDHLRWPFTSSSNCQANVYIQTQWLLSAGQYEEAFDYWELSSSESNRPVEILPAYFQSVLDARISGKNERWASAVASYREAFWLATHSGEDHDLVSIEPEYRDALIHDYESRAAHLNHGELLRQALWLWRAGHLNNSWQAFVELKDKVDLAPALKNRAAAYALLVQAEIAVSENRAHDALEYYLGVSPREHPVYLRALLGMAELERNIGSYPQPSPWRQELADWTPSIFLSYASNRDGVHVVGAEFLEPELIPDGGETCILLFAEGKPYDSTQIVIAGNKFVDEVCGLNLIQDPGFEWSRNNSQASPWFADRYPQDDNPPYWKSGTAENRSAFVCFTNPAEEAGSYRSGIMQQGPTVTSPDEFLLAVRLTSLEGARGTLMGRWQDNTGRPNLFYVDYLAGSGTWQWVGGIVESIPEAWGVQVHIVNYQTPGTVCADDLVMISLDVP